MSFELFPSQLVALRAMHNGCILNGDVGSGKSLTSIAYYYMINGGDISFLKGGAFKPMLKEPTDLYIITTAKKRDTHEWEGDLSYFLLSPNKECSYYKNNIIIDSWNNIPKYKDVKNAFFIFDEQRVVGYGEWTKSFLKIAKFNKWILLSATPGDTWMDYIPVFIANGYYKNKKDFCDNHVIWDPYVKYPKVTRFVNVERLVRLRDRVLVDMDDNRKTIPHHLSVTVQYDRDLYNVARIQRKNPFDFGYTPCDPEDNGALLVGTDISIDNVTPILPGWEYTPENGDYVLKEYPPIKSASEYCYILRKIVNSDLSRAAAIKKLARKHKRLIVFYKFDYELDILKSIDFGSDYVVSEWNGHKHLSAPDSDKWVYLVQYTAGCEGWNCIKTNAIAFYSQDYSYKVVKQATGRIDRINTPYIDLYYYHLYSVAPIDRSIRLAIKNKGKFNERRFAGGLFEQDDI